MTAHNIDPVRVGEEIFYNIFHHIFHDEGARKYFEFSQINFFNSAEGLPGWNLWFLENTRVYQLALVQAREISDDVDPAHKASFHKPAIEGRFAVRYFPGADDPELDNYSCAEALLRFGPLFDHTGTPNLTGQDSMDDNYFVVGYLDFRTDTERNFLEIECIAPNRWKDVRVDGLYLKTLENMEYKAVEPGGIDRNLPGWDLAFFLFDKLISGCCYAYKTTPFAVIFAEKKWTRFDIDKDNCCIKKMDPDIDLFQLIIGLEINACRNGTCRNGTCCQNSMTRDAYIEAVSDRLSAKELLVSGVCKGPENIVKTKMNPEWWSVKEKIFSRDAESEMQHCCYHDH